MKKIAYIFDFNIILVLMAGCFLLFSVQIYEVIKNYSDKYLNGFHRSVAEASEKDIHIEVQSRLDDDKFTQMLVALDTERADKKHDKILELSMLDDPRVLPILTSYLNDDIWINRAYAAKALGTFGNEEAIPSLIKALKDENWLVRLESSKSLQNLGLSLPVSIESTP